MTRDQAAQILDGLHELLDIEDGKDWRVAVDALLLASAALRGPEWVRTADRMPEDDNFQMLIVYISDECFIGARYVWEVKEKPNKFQYYIPMPKLPEGEI